MTPITPDTAPILPDAAPTPHTCVYTGAIDKRRPRPLRERLFAFHSNVAYVNRYCLQLEDLKHITHMIQIDNRYDLVAIPEILKAHDPASASAATFLDLQRRVISWVRRDTMGIP